MNVQLFEHVKKSIARIVSDIEGLKAAKIGKAEAKTSLERNLLAIDAKGELIPALVASSEEFESDGVLVRQINPQRLFDRLHGNDPVYDDLYGGKRHKWVVFTSGVLGFVRANSVIAMTALAESCGESLNLDKGDKDAQEACFRVWGELASFGTTSMKIATRSVQRELSPDSPSIQALLDLFK